MTDATTCPKDTTLLFTPPPDNLRHNGTATVVNDGYRYTGVPVAIVGDTALLSIGRAETCAPLRRE